MLNLKRVFPCVGDGLDCETSKVQRRGLARPRPPPGGGRTRSRVRGRNAGERE